MRLFLRRFREKKLYLYILSSLLVVVALPILLFSVSYYNDFATQLAKKTVTSGTADMSHYTANLDEVIVLCNKMAASLELERCFTPEYILTHSTAFIDIQKKLKALSYVSAKFANVFYACDQSATLFTRDGTFNLQRFANSKTPRADMPNAKHLRFGKLAYFGSAAEHSTVLPASGKTFEYIVPMLYGHGLLGFSLRADLLLPAGSESNGFLFGEDGTLLGASAAVDTADFLSGIPERFTNASSGFEYLNGEHVYYLRQKTSSGLTALYLLPYDSIFNDLNQTNHHFLLLLAITCLGSILIVAFLLHHTYTPIREMQLGIREMPITLPTGLNEAETAQYAMRYLFHQNNALLTKYHATVQERLMAQLIRTHVSEAVIEACYQEGVLVRNTPVWAVLLGTEGTPEINRSALPAEFVRLLEMHFTVAYSELNVGKQQLLLLSPKVTDVPFALQQAHAELVRRYGACFRVGVSKPQADFHCVAHIFRQADKALAHAESTRSLCFYSELPKSLLQAFHYPHTEIEALYSAILNQSTERVLTLSDMLIHIVQKNTSGEASLYLYYDILSRVLHGASHFEAFSAAIAADERFAYSNIVLHGVEDFVVCFSALIELLLQNMTDTNELYIRALYAIEQQLNNPDLYADRLAAQLEIPLVKLNFLFKEKSGQTVT
ncbi:MAG: hypothetical protein RSI33_08955, partial [Clostridia bacterium]